MANSVSVTSIVIHERSKPDATKPVDNFDGAGADLAALFRGFLVHLPREKRLTEHNQQYITIEAAEGEGAAVFVRAEFGYYGDPGRTRDVDTEEVLHTWDGNVSPREDLRAVLVAPPGERRALLFSERAKGRTVGPRLLDLFEEQFKAKWGGKLMLKRSTVNEAEAWLEHAGLKSVIAFEAYSPSHDIADAGAPTFNGRIEHKMLPSGGDDHLPRRIFDLLRSGQLKASQLFLLDEERIDSVKVTVGDEERSKSFELQKLRLPSLSYRISDAAGQVPGDRALRRFCLLKASELFELFDTQWDPAWEDGTWSPERNMIKLEVPDAQ